MTPRRDRTPLVLGIVAAVLAVAVIVALAILVGRGMAPSPGDAGDGTSVSQPADDGDGDGTDGTPAESDDADAPDPDASDPAAAPTGEPAEMRLSATGFSLVDPSGAEVFTYGWGDDAQGAVTALTEAFGSAPNTRTEPGNGSYPEYTVYGWSGFSLYDMVSGATAREDYTQPSYVRVSADEVGDIVITPEFDLAVGAPIADVRALGPDRETPRGAGTRFVFADDRSAYNDGKPSYSVIVDANADEVTAILYFFYFAG